MIRSQATDASTEASLPDITPEIIDPGTEILLEAVLRGGDPWRLSREIILAVFALAEAKND